MTSKKVNLGERLSLFDEHWSPKVVGELNGQHVKLVTLSSEFVGHHHDEDNEQQLLVKGRFRMEYRDREEWIEAGEFVVVPSGVERGPVAEEQAHVMLFEPAGTVNAGSAGGGMTVAELDRI